MKIITKMALLRILIGLGVLSVIFGALGWFMVKTPRRAKGQRAEPLSDKERGKLKRALMEHVEMLAKTIGERHVDHPENLKRAAQYIEDTWTEMGYKVEHQSYDVDGVECVNLQAERLGSKPELPILIAGAHYDSVPRCPAANDNASGVAALLELSRIFRSAVPARTIRFVAFTNEEPPFFQTEKMGSRVYAKKCRREKLAIRLMISLETIGYFTDEPRSQKYPPPFSLFYPSKGDFIAFVANLASRSEMHKVVGLFRKHTDFPVESLASPAFIPGIDWSDHASFWEEGCPALMITDTAPFRYPYYHTSGDTPNELDYDAMTEIVYALSNVLRELADER